MQDSDALEDGDETFSQNKTNDTNTSGETFKNLQALLKAFNLQEQKLMDDKLKAMKPKNLSPKLQNRHLHLMAAKRQTKYMDSYLKTHSDR